MQSKRHLIFHLTCLVYAPYLGKLLNPENDESSIKLHILNARKLNVKVLLTAKLCLLALFYLYIMQLLV